MDLVLFIGLQGAGKSRFYRDCFASTHRHVSKDLLRNHRRPQRRQMVLIEEALREGQSVVVDNTNPTSDDRAVIIRLAKGYGARVIGYYFDVSLEDCLERNAQRTGKAKVPELALYATLKRMRPPLLEEGFDQLWRVTLAALPEDRVVVREFTEEGRP